MKVVAINGSSRKACFACAGKGNCVFNDDSFQELYRKMTEADGILRRMSHPRRKRLSSVPVWCAIQIRECSATIRRKSHSELASDLIGDQHY